MIPLEMLTHVLALALGILIGLLGALPGVHASVLLVGMLPALALGGDHGALVVAGALGSGAVASTLAKTFHPASPETLRSATPEQVMAYRGDGHKAVFLQLQGVHIGLAVAILLALPALLFAATNPDGIRAAYGTVVKPLAPWVIAAYTAAVVATAKNKLTTVLTMVGAGLLGFVAFNHPSSTEDVLSGLLGGAFSAAPLLMVLGHQGKLSPFPHQRPARPAGYSPEGVWGALAGIAAACCAGIGSSAGVSVLAGRVKEHAYLVMQAASESANNAFALALLILVGTTRSGAAVAVQQSGTRTDIVLGGLLLLGVLGGVAVGSIVIRRVAPAYVRRVASLSPRGSAALVLCLTVGLTVWHAGPFGVGVLVASTLLGLAAKASYAPNQALVTMLTTPVLIYYVGASGALASLLGIMR